MKNPATFTVILISLSLHAVAGLSQDFRHVGQVACGYSAYPIGLAEDPEGNLLFCGTFPGSADMDMSQEGEAILTANSKNDIFVAKYDQAGNYLWAFHLGGSSSDNHSVRDIDTDSDGNVYICGIERSWLDFDPGEEKDSLWTGGNMFYLAKYSKEGEYLWAHVFGYSATNKNIYAHCLSVDKVDGSVYVSGSFGEELDFDPSSEGAALLVPDRNNDLFLAKYDTDGNYTWAKVFSGPDVFSMIQPTTLTIDDQRNVYMGGYFSGIYDMDPSETSHPMEEHTTESYSGNDAFLASYDKDASYRWHLNVGSGYGNYVRSIEIYEGKLYAVGDFMDSVDFDPSSSEFYLTSAKMESSGFLSVYNTDGQFQSAMGLHGYELEFSTSVSRINDVAFDNLGKCYLVGSIAGTIDFDPSEATSDISSTGGFSDWDMFLAQYDLDLQLQWVIHAGGNDQEQGLDVAVTSLGEVVAAGFFDGDCDFDPSENEHWMLNPSHHDLFLAWYFAFEPIGVQAFTGKDHPMVHIYPNPAREFLVVESNRKLESIRIFSSTGALIKTYSASASRMKIDVSSLLPSWYMVEITSEDTVERIPMIRTE